jgi:hypothetical protein
VQDRQKIKPDDSPFHAHPLDKPSFWAKRMTG